MRLCSLRPDLFEGFIILTSYHHVCFELFVQKTSKYYFFFISAYGAVLTNSHGEKLKVAPLNLLDETCLWDHMWEHIVQTDKHLAGWRFLVNITARDKKKKKKKADTNKASQLCDSMWNEKEKKLFSLCGGGENDVDTRRPDIDPDSGVGQVPTQGPQPALMTIDNNLSLFDFQPNSLLETRRADGGLGGGSLPLDCQPVKWSEKGLITRPALRPPGDRLGSCSQTAGGRSTCFHS